MLLFAKPVKILEKKDSKAVFEIEELYPGYGVTIGNSIRRVLLSSLGGSAITQVKIKGVPHEFSTLPGVFEDSVSLLLNLKQMRFRMVGDEPQRATLVIKGEKEARGEDFKFPSQLELMNPGVHIATLTQKNAELEMEIKIEKGIGYVQAKDLNKSKGEIGVLYLDAIFTPMRNVSYKVEQMRVGERTDFDKLTMEIETDGTMSPEAAFLEACDILIKQFDSISAELRISREAGGFEQKDPKGKEPEKKKKTVKAKKKIKK